MSVILTDMDMPNSCYECRLKTRCEYALANGWVNNKRDDNCPLKPYEERKKSKWIRDGHHIGCKNCGEYMCETDGEGDKIPINFCPNCGAKMEGAEE